MKKQSKSGVGTPEKQPQSGAFPVAAGSASSANEIPNGAARALCYVPLYDMLFEVVAAIKDDPEASSEMRKLAQRASNVLRHTKAAVHPSPNTAVSQPGQPLLNTRNPSANP